MKEIKPISWLLAAVLVRCCFRRIETFCFRNVSRSDLFLPHKNYHSLGSFQQYFLWLDESRFRNLGEGVCGGELNLLPLRERVKLLVDSKLDWEILEEFREFVVIFEAFVWEEKIRFVHEMWENPIICTFWSTQLFQQETISKSDQQSVKHRISVVKLTKTLETNPCFFRVKPKNGAQFDQGWFFPSSWFLPQGAVTWNMPGAASVWKIWFKCVRWPVTFATGRFRRRFVPQNTQKTWRKHQTSDQHVLNNHRTMQEITSPVAFLDEQWHTVEFLSFLLVSKVAFCGTPFRATNIYFFLINDCLFLRSGSTPSKPGSLSCFSPTAECYGVFAQSRFRCVLGEMGRFRERTGFREPVPGTEGGSIRWLPTGSGFRRWFQVSMSSNRFRFGKWLRFRRFWIWWFLMGSDGFEGWDQVITTLGLAQCVWQCCAESECIRVKRDC